MGDAQEPAPKRIRLAYHHRHKIQQKPQELPPHEPSLIDSRTLDQMVFASIKAICEEEGLKQDIHDPIIETVPLEALRNAAEEFMVQLCAKVRRSMIASRRTVPIATDFESAFDVLDLPRPDDQLESYQTEHTINPSLLPTPPPEDPFHNHVELSSAFLGPDLSKQDALNRYSFNTSSLPPLPSAHTYKDTHVLVRRETDTRKIRELATEEGKLGEQALRKLAAAVKLETALSTESNAGLLKAKRGTFRRRPTLTEEVLFEETVKDLLKSERGNFELGPVVTSEKAFRMPDEARVKRRPVAANKSAAQHGSDFGSSGKYNLLPPPLPKHPSSTAATDMADLSFEL